jgi:hypothetical protein
MLKEVLSHVTCRLSSPRDAHESLSKCSPVILLNQISRPMFSELLFIHNAGKNVSKNEEQYRQMPFVDWKGEATFKKDEQFGLVYFNIRHLKSSPTLSLLA